MLAQPLCAAAGPPLVPEAMKLILDRHYPEYPVTRRRRLLLGLVAVQTLFEHEAFEITAQAGRWSVSRRRAHRYAVHEQLQVPQSVAARQPRHRTHRWHRRRDVPGHDRPSRHPRHVPACARETVGQHGCQALAVTVRGMTLGDVKEGHGGELTWEGGVARACQRRGDGAALRNRDVHVRGLAGIAARADAGGSSSRWPWSAVAA